MRQFEQLFLEGKFRELLELTEEDLSIGGAKYWQLSALLRLGRYDEAIKLVWKYEKSLENMEMEWKSKFLNRIGTIYHLKGELDEALKYYKRSLKLDQKLGNSKDLAKSFNNIGLLHWNKGDLDQALRNYQSSFILFQELGNNQDMAASLNNLGLLWRDKGELDKALEYHEQSWKLRVGIGNTQDIANSLTNIGSIYRKKGEPVGALKYHFKALVLYEEVGNKQEIAWTLNFIGLAYWLTGELDRALEYYEQSLVIHEEIQNNQDIADLLNNIGLIYANKGESEHALENYEKSLKLREEIGNKHEIAASFSNISEIYRYKGLTDTALNYAKNGLKLREDLGNKQGIAASLRSIINCLVDGSEPHEATKYLEQLNRIAEVEDNKVIRLYQNHALGLFLKASNRSRNKIKSQEIFEDIVKTNDFDFEIRVDSLGHLVELLILEYKTYQEDEVLGEIVKNVNLMHTISETHKMFRVFVDILILQSRLAIIQNDFDRANEFLNQALTIAKRKKMTQCIQQVEGEKLMLKKNLNELRKIVQTSSIAIQLEKTAIVDYIKKARGIIS